MLILALTTILHYGHGGFCFSCLIPAVPQVTISCEEKQGMTGNCGKRLSKNGRSKRFKQQITNTLISCKRMEIVAADRQIIGNSETW